MLVEYDDKKNSKLTTFSIDKGVKVVKSTEVIGVRELFFIISSRVPSVEIKLHPKNMVHFWDLTERKWKLVYLKKEEKSGKGEEADEADEAEDLKEPWNMEEDEGKGKNGGEDSNKQKE